MTMKNAHNIIDRFTGSVIFTAEIQVADDAPKALRLGAAIATAVAAPSRFRTSSSTWISAVKITEPVNRSVIL